MNSAIGVDIGGTKIAVGLVDENGSVRGRTESATPHERGPDAILATVVQLARDLLPVTGATAVGIGAAGVIDSTTGVVLSSTDALPGWAGTRLGAEVSQALALPTFAMNDVHAHALGEAWLGSAHTARSALVIAVGTGVGGALLIDGSVWKGAHAAAGHFGHVPCPEASGLRCSCGGYGHLEAVASGPAILAAYTRRGRSRVNPEIADARAVVALAESGDSSAREVIESSARALGRAAAGLVNALDPETVVVGGGVADSGPTWWSALRSGFESDLLPVVAGCDIVPASLGADAAIIGSARAAMQQLQEVR